MAPSGPSAEGTVQALFLKVAHGQPMQPVAHVTAVAGQGFSGDLSFGHPDRQVLLMAAEDLAALDLAPGTAKENVTVASLALSALPPGTTLRLGDALLAMTDQCKPCGFMDSLRPGLQKASRGRRGVFAQVVKGGGIGVGDVVRGEVLPSS